MPRGLDITDLEYLACPPCANIQTTLCVYHQAKNNALQLRRHITAPSLGRENQECVEARDLETLSAGELSEISNDIMTTLVDTRTP
jgi:hypothetical protein